MTPEDFVKKWKTAQLTERQSYVSHWLDLCEMLGQPKPTDIDPKGDFYCFERGAAKLDGGDGWADVWWRGKFCVEYKGKKKDLGAAYRQLQQYHDSLENPPLLICLDTNKFEIHTKFTGAISRIFSFELDHLLKKNGIEVKPNGTSASKLSALQILRCCFENPEELNPRIESERITGEASAAFARIAESMAKRYKPEEVAHFLMKVLFVLFAEWCALIKKRPFIEMLDEHWTNADFIKKQMKDLFALMRDGGNWGPYTIPHFNGGLFDNTAVLELTIEEIEDLRDAASKNWAQVDPTVFGTLFERSLDPAQRSQLGAHYTSVLDILRVVEPVIMRPLKREWEAVKKQSEPILIEIEGKKADVAKARAGEARKRAESSLEKSIAKLLPLYRGFLDRLKQVKVLDPACGSGNFLYVALQQLKNLEGAVINEATQNGLYGLLPGVHPRQLLGMEINTYAHELAQTVVWIGYLQWNLNNDFKFPSNPMLEKLDNIEHKDALLVVGRDGKPKAKLAEWPEADFIVGNPPFLGGKKLRSELGDEYVDTLFKCYGESVAAEADLSTYWQERARAQIEAGKAKRAGLLATQGIRGGANQKTLKRILETGTIFEAWSDLKWTLKGAAVHISIVCQCKRAATQTALAAQPVMAGHAQPADGKTPASKRKSVGTGKSKSGTARPAVSPGALSRVEGPDMAKMAMPLPLELESDIRLDGVPVPGVNADLTSSNQANLTDAKRLGENLNISYMGDTKGGAFDLDPGVARELLAAKGNPNGKPNSDVIVPWVNAKDLTARSRGWSIIDFVEMPEEQAAKYEAPFEYVRKHVKPARDQNKRETYRERWWIHVEPRFKMREALTQLRRFVATPTVAKHRLFVWLKAPTLPDHQLIVFAREDDYFFGVLHSVTHERWALELGTQLEDRPRYTPTTCFETFPFPQPSDAQRAAIALAAKELNDLREAWLNPKGLSEAELKKRTLTNLYNERPTWLHNAHIKLDKAVLAAYGWGDLSPEDLHANEKPTRMKAEQELLKRLLALNLERAG